MARKLNTYSPAAERSEPFPGHLPSAAEYAEGARRAAANRDILARAIIGRRFPGAEGLRWPPHTLRELSVIAENFASIQGLDGEERRRFEAVEDPLTRRLSLARLDATIAHLRAEIAGIRARMVETGLRLPESDDDLREACRPIWGEWKAAIAVPPRMDGVPEMPKGTPGRDGPAPPPPSSSLGVPFDAHAAWRR